MPCSLPTVSARPPLRVGASTLKETSVPRLAGRQQHACKAEPSGRPAADNPAAARGLLPLGALAAGFGLMYIPALAQEPTAPAAAASAPTVPSPAASAVVGRETTMPAIAV